jgi:predicted alpha-1,6-mannanase (GH76 family)
MTVANFGSEGGAPSADSVGSATDAALAGTPAARAAAAEQAVVNRHVKRLWALPTTALGRVGWPPSIGERLFVRWHYWWQAHLLDCLVDAWQRDPSAERARRVRAFVRGQFVRNGFRWTNAYYDDMAWLGLALNRAHQAGLVDATVPVRQLTSRILAAAAAAPTTGIPWRVGDDYLNTPANGPAAILLARTGQEAEAGRLTDWILANLRDPSTGLVLDGLHPGQPIAPEVYSYCQGVVLGALTELARRSTGERSEARSLQAAALVRAVTEHLTVDGVLIGHGGGNGGLFTGILARYLAQVASDLPGAGGAIREARHLASDLVVRAADAAWAHQAAVDDLPLFGADWSAPTGVPRSRQPGRQTPDGADSSPEPQRDLSVQLGGWMLMEAATRLRVAD